MFFSFCMLEVLCSLECNCSPTSKRNIMEFYLRTQVSSQTWAITISDCCDAPDVEGQQQVTPLFPFSFREKLRNKTWESERDQSISFLVNEAEIASKAEVFSSQIPSYSSLVGENCTPLPCRDTAHHCILRPGSLHGENAPGVGPYRLASFSQPPSSDQTLLC